MRHLSWKNCLHKKLAESKGKVINILKKEKLRLYFNYGFIKPSGPKFVLKRHFLLSFEIEITFLVRTNQICYKISRLNLCNRSNNLLEESEFHGSELLG